MLIRRLQADDSRISPGKPVTIGEAWEEEKTKLLSLHRFPYRCCVSRPVKANHYSLVSFDGNRYSVPVEYQGSRLVLHGLCLEDRSRLWRPYYRHSPAAI